jgi:hypothetical protein
VPSLVAAYCCSALRTVLAVDGDTELALDGTHPPGANDVRAGVVSRRESGAGLRPDNAVHDETVPLLERTDRTLRLRAEDSVRRNPELPLERPHLRPAAAYVEKLLDLPARGARSELRSGAFGRSRCGRHGGDGEGDARLARLRKLRPVRVRLPADERPLHRELPQLVLGQVTAPPGPIGHRVVWREAIEEREGVECGGSSHWGLPSGHAPGSYKRRAPTYVSAYQPVMVEIFTTSPVCGEWMNWLPPM